MRSTAIILLSSLLLAACSPPKGDGEEPSTGSTLCTSVSTASLSLKSRTARPLAFSTQGKLRLDLTTTKLKSPVGPGQLLVDFKSQAFSDPTQVTVAAGTKLVAVVDHACTRAKGYRARDGNGFFYSEKIMNAKAEGFQSDRYADKTHSHSIELAGDMSLAQLERMAEADECLTMLSSNIVFKPFITYPPNDTQLASQTHLPYVKWDQAYNKFFDNPGISQTVVIAIIDSGVDITHSDLSANVWVNAADPVNGSDDDGNGYVDDRNGYNFATDIASPNPIAWPYPSTGAEGHGTHVAGLAAARQANGAGVSGVFGTAQVKIMALNVFGGTPSADTATIDESIRYAKNMGADVINMSLGGLGQVASTGVAIQEAIAADVVIVAASGNSNIVLDAATFMTPASYAASNSGMIAVGSVDAVNGSRSSFSNCGNTVVEIAAPGAHNSNLETSLGGLLSTLPSSTYGRSMGTSMSSPIVAGAAALAIGLKRSLAHSFTNADIETLLKSTSTTTSALTPYFQNGKVLNLQTLVNSISP